jgi:hypothetical protein
MGIFKNLRKQKKNDFQPSTTSKNQIESEAHYLIRVVEALVDMDINASSSFFHRDLSDRYKTVGQIALKITGSNNDAVTYMTPSELEHTPKRVSSAYREMLKEVYELCAVLEVYGTIMNPNKKSLLDAVELWQSYLEYSRDYPEQLERIKIARHHLDHLQVSL